MHRFANIFKLGVRMLPFATIPILLQPQYQSFFWNSLNRNNIDKRFYNHVEVSNNPCEDRSDHLQLSAIDGYAAAVYDGHGGWQVVNYCVNFSRTFVVKNYSKILIRLLEITKTKFQTRMSLFKLALDKLFKKQNRSFCKLPK